MRTIIPSILFFLYLNFTYAQSGMPDPSFGINGIVKTDMGASFIYNNAARKVLLSPDGSIYLVLNEASVSKRLSNGSIDSGYGFNGYSGSLPFSEASAAIQPDKKIVLVGSASDNSFIVARLTVGGVPDSAFGNNGIQTTEFSGPSFARSVAIQSDGKIVVAGYTTDDNNNAYFVVTRYNINGSKDNTFNGNGQSVMDFKFKIPPEQGSDSIEIHNAYAYSVIIQADGKIVAGGYAYTGIENDFAVARYNSNGSPDNTFDTDGKQTTNFGSSDDVGYSLAIQTDGKILLAGYTSFEGNNSFAVARYNVNGSLDNSFDEDGKQTASLGSDMQIGNSLAIQSNGKIIVAGYTLNGDHNDFAIARFNTDGSADNTFDTDGIVTTDFSSGDDYAGSLVIQSDNKILVAGYSYIYSPARNVQQIAVSRYNIDGSLDQSFADKGKLDKDNKQGSTKFNSTAIQADGKIVVAGRTWNGNDYDFAIARYNTNGTLDNTFSDDGEQITDLGGVDAAISVVIQTDGKIVVAGNSGDQFAITRYNTDGSLDKTFSDDGKLIIFMGFADVCQSLALQKDGKIVMAGFTYTDPNYDSAFFAIARLNINGVPDNTFSGDGKQLTDFDASPSFAASVAIQSDGKILAGGRSYLSNQNNFSLARYNNDGSLDLTFSQDGKQNNTFSGDDYFGQSLAIQNDGKIIMAGYSEEFSGSSSFAVARYQPNGDLDNTFNGNGFQAISLGPHFNYATSVAINYDGRIAVGGTNDDNIIMLYKSNGTLDSSFGKNGIQINKIGIAESSIRSLAFVDNKLYAAGHGSYPGNFGVVTRFLLSNSNPLVSVITAANGNWNQPGTWVGGVVPNSNSPVIVRHNVSITANASCSSLKVESPTGYVIVTTGTNLTITH